MASPEQARQIDAICLRMSIERHLERAIATTISAAVVAKVLSSWVDGARLWWWFGVVVAFNLARVATWRWLRGGRTDDEVLAHTALYVLLMECSALTWGVLIAVAGWPTETTEIAIILLAIAGMMAGGAHSVSVTPRTMYASMVFSLLPIFLHMLFSGEPTLRLIPLLVVGHVLGVAGAVRSVNREARTSIALRFENAALVKDLRVEKEREFAARQAAERANTEKSRFVAAASHDARQPLHAMGLLLDALKGQPLEPKSTKLVTSIDVAHGSLVALHEGLLELSVAEVGRQTPRLVDMPLAQVFDPLLTESGPRAKLRGLQLDVKAAPLTLHSDPALLLRVLRNLVSNALTYTTRGRVLVTARRRGDHALLQVWDTGVGITAEHLPKIFDELYQVGNAARDRAQGLGLGLAIVKRLATALETEVTVRSQPGRGSVFSLQIPLALARPTAAVLPTQSGAVALVVDDDALARHALATMLEQWGFEVVSASDAEEARGYVAELERLDVVVSDLWLPGATGLEFLAGLDAKPGLKRVLMSGDTTPEAEAKVRASGLTFVRKPVRAPRLAEALRVAG